MSNNLSLISIRNFIVRHIFDRPFIWWSAVNFVYKHFLCSVIGIIRDDNNNILLLDHKYRPDSFSLPAGWLKKGETPFEAITREIKEETNFNIKPTRLLSVGSSKINSHLEFVVEAKYIDGTFAESSEISNYKWVSPSIIKDLKDVYCCSLNDNGGLNEDNNVSMYTANW